LDRVLVEARLKEAGLRLTPQRFAVMDQLLAEHGHPTAEDLYAKVNRRFPRASRATVYNTLHSLCRAGLVREVHYRDGIAQYDPVPTPHSHLLCSVCGELEDIPQLTFGEAELTNLIPGCRIEACEVLVRGTCAACCSRAIGVQIHNLRG